MEEARKEYAEALQIYQPFAKQDPQRFLADVAEDKEAAGAVTESKLSLKRPAKPQISSDHGSGDLSSAPVRASRVLRVPTK